MRVAIVTGILVRFDAVSNAVLHERNALQEAGHEVRVFTQHTDLPDPEGVVCGADPWVMATGEWFRSCGLVIYHFATGYELFAALVLSHESARRAVRFHNVTTPELLDDPAARYRAQRGLDQIHCAENADVVWCVSDFNRRTLERIGVTGVELKVLPLHVPAVDVAAGVETGRREGLLYVGRLVEAKGVGDLVEAFLRLAGEQGPTLDVVGNQALSSPELVVRLQDLAEVTPGLTLHLGVDDDDRDRLMRTRRVMVIPSHHEGFCVPAIEAMAAGMDIVASTAGALPETLDAMALFHEPGDVDGLTEALAAALVGPARPAHREGLERYGWSTWRAEFLAEVDALLRV